METCMSNIHIFAWTSWYARHAWADPKDNSM